MLITCEEDEFRHEQGLRDRFSERTANLNKIRIRLYADLEPANKDALTELLSFAENERPLFACFHSSDNFVVITNRRIFWQTNQSSLRSLTWECIKSIQRGTPEQRAICRALKSREQRAQEVLKWNGIELTEQSGDIHMVELEHEPVLEAIHWSLTSLHGTYRRHQRGKNDPDAYIAHKYAGHNRDLILQSDQCGCFYCLHIFPPSSIEHWIDSDKTAMCPRCHIDSVLGSKSGYPITTEFLQRMKRFWF